MQFFSPPSAELDLPVVRHGLYAGEGLDPDALGADELAPGLEGLLYRDARADNGGARLAHQGDEPVQGSAVCQEVVNYEHPVPGADVVLRDQDGVGVAVGEGVDRGGPEIAE